MLRCRTKALPVIPDVDLKKIKLEKLITKADEASVR